MKSILVLEGGALIGIYTAGVLDCLMDNGVNIDSIVGVSAGALFGVNYVSKQRGRCIRYNLDNINNKDYMGFYSYLKTGNIMNSDFCFNKLIYETDPFDFNTFNSSKTKFYCVVTNVNTGKSEYKKINNIEKDIDYLKASGSIPILSKIVNINGNLYLDGGVSDSIPVKWAIDNHYDKIIVVKTRPEGYRKKKRFILPFILKYRKYPKFINTYKNRYINYNNTIDFIKNLEENSRIFVVRPSKDLKIKHIEKNKNKILDMYNLGYNDMSNSLKSLNDYLYE